VPCGWEGNRSCGIALAMRHRLQWFIQLRAHDLDREMSTPPTLLAGYDNTHYRYIVAVVSACIVRCVYSTARVKQTTTCPTQLPTALNRQLKQVSAMFLHRTATHYTCANRSTFDLLAVGPKFTLPACRAAAAAVIRHRQQVDMYIETNIQLHRQHFKK